MKKYIFTLIGISSFLVSCDFEVKFGKNAQSCFDFGHLNNAGECVIEADQCSKLNGIYFDGKCTFSQCINHGGYIDDSNQCTFDGNTCFDLDDNPIDPKICEDIADCINHGSYFDANGNCVQSNPLQEKLDTCISNGKIDNATIYLENDITIKPGSFGVCDLINSEIIGVDNSRKIVITVEGEEGEGEEGEEEESKNNQIYNALFKNIKNSTIKNIELKYNVNFDGSADAVWKSDGTDDDSDGKGLLARTITGSKLSNIDINGKLTLNDIQHDEKNIGALAGIISDTTVENVNFKGSIDLATDKNVNQPIKLYNVGGLVGLFFIDQCQEDDDKCWVMRNITVGNRSDEIDNVIQINSNASLAVENVGGLVGYVRRLTTNDTPRYFLNNKVYANINISDTSSDNTTHSAKSIGGQFGSIVTPSSNSDIFSHISSSSYEGVIQVDTGTMFGCGGFIGDIDGCLVDNISVKNTMNLKTIKKTVDENAAANGVPRILNYSMTNVGGVIGFVKNSTVQNATLDVTMNLTGGYFNRIGGVLGASSNSTFDQIADSKNGNIHVPIKLNISEYCVGSSECPTEDKLFDDLINKNIITTPNITFLGGFVGKSHNSNYENVDVSLNLDIDWGSLTCHGNSSDDDKIHLMHYVGNMFGYDSFWKSNDNYGRLCNSDNVPDSTQFKLPDCSQEIIYCLSPMN